jgi:hypothetical protein
MFKKICIKSKEFNSSNFDIAFIIDSMLYYRKVILLVHRKELEILFQEFGRDTLKELISSKRLELKFRNNMLGSIIAPDGKYGISTFIGKDINAHSTLYGIDRRDKRNSIKNLAFADEFSSLIQPYEYPKDFDKTIVKDFQNIELIKKQITTYFNTIAPFYKLPDVIEIEIIQEGNFMGFETYKVNSNIDLEYLTNEFKNSNPENTNRFDFSGFLLAIAESKGDIYISSDLESEIVTSNLYSKFIEIEISDIIKKRGKSEKEINLFEDYILENCYSLGTAFNEGIISRKDLLTILEKSDQFREWLDKIPEEKNLLGEYNKAILEKDLSDRLSTKTARFVIFEGIGITLDIMGAGVIGTTIATGLSAFDNFILDKLINKKWKPNQFIENTLKPKIQK